jgi:hypothetical protein
MITVFSFSIEKVSTKDVGESRLSISVKKVEQKWNEKLLDKFNEQV